MRFFVNNTRTFLTNGQKTLQALPITIKKIKRSADLRFILTNALMINGLEFTLPFLMLYFAESMLTPPLKSIYPNYKEDKSLTFLYSLISFLFFIHFKFKNIVFNTVATLGANKVMEDEYDDQIQHHLLCKACTINTSDKLSKAISLQIHYFLGTLIVSTLQLFLNNQLAYIGYPLSFTLGAYWKGFVIFQYPLARDKVCAEHQILLLMKNRSLLIAFGAMLETFELGLTQTMIFGLQNTIPNKIVATAVSNLVTTLGLMHAHQVSIPIPSRSQESSSKQPPLDLLLGIWLWSLYSTSKLASFALFLLKKNNALSRFEKPKKILIYFYIYILPLITPQAFTSLKAFSATPVMSPYMRLFLIDGLLHLQEIKKTNDKPLIWLTRFTLKGILFFPYGKEVLAYCTSIPIELTKVLKAILKLDIESNLEKLYKTVDDALTTSRKNNAYNFYGITLFPFGVNPPKGWEENRGVIQVESPEEESFLPTSNEDTANNRLLWRHE